ncbi:MAG: hypothetical protein JXR37_09805 [Kiritimatiellae bacterium]|nr:hypothetical protein [Kiritimatiellia bacterium]
MRMPNVARFLHLNRAINRGDRKVRWFKLPERELYRGDDRYMAVDRDMQIVPQGGGSSLSRTRLKDAWRTPGIGL